MLHLFPSSPPPLRRLSAVLASSSSETTDHDRAAGPAVATDERPCPCLRSQIRLMRLVRCRSTAAGRSLAGTGLIVNQSFSRRRRRRQPSATDMPISRLGISTICLLIALRRCVVARYPPQNLVCCARLPAHPPRYLPYLSATSIVRRLLVTVVYAQLLFT